MPPNSWSSCFHGVVGAITSPIILGQHSAYWATLLDLSWFKESVSQLWGLYRHTYYAPHLDHTWFSHLFLCLELLLDRSWIRNLHFLSCKNWVIVCKLEFEFSFPLSCWAAWLVWVMGLAYFYLSLHSLGSIFTVFKLLQMGTSCVPIHGPGHESGSEQGPWGPQGSCLLSALK